MVTQSEDGRGEELCLRCDFQIGNHAVTLEDDSSGYVEDFFPKSNGELFDRGSAIPAGTAINVENSNDVVIGTLTQFHGPVTIYQSPPADKRVTGGNNGENDKTSDGGNKNDAELVKTDERRPAKKQWLVDKLARGRSSKLFPVYAAMGVSLLALVLAAAALAVANILQEADVEEEKNPPSSTPSGHKFFDRHVWGGREADPDKMRPLKHPTELVIVSHTAGVFCKKLLECGPVLQAIQAFHVSTFGSPDIGHNFLIGGDGNIYVGRGWDHINFQDDGNIAVSYIGNFVYDRLDERMISALEELLEVGVKLGKLSTDYKLVAHNQTYATDSPGRHVFEEICKLPHFDPYY